MKKLLALLIAGAFVVPTISYAKEEPKKAAPAVTAAPAAKPADAKKDTAPAPETKKACIKTTDPKTGKEVEKCRTVKIHEKHEGTKIEDAKKK
jgi:hypothetical protein